jgi:hypothetical protein
LSFGVPDWLPHLRFSPLANINNNTKWWEDNTCKNLTKNQFIFIGFKNATDCIQYIELLRDDVPVQDTMIDNYQIRNYIPNVVKTKSQRENKCRSFTIWENVQEYDSSMCSTYISTGICIRLHKETPLVNFLFHSE